MFLFLPMASSSTGLYYFTQTRITLHGTRTIFKRFVKSHTNPFYTYPSPSHSQNPLSVINFTPIKKFHSQPTVHAKNLRNCWSGSSKSDRSETGAKMTVTAIPCIKDRSLMINGKVLLSGVPSEVTVYPLTAAGSSSCSSAAFLGASSCVPSSRHVFSLGVLQECKFLCLFRHKIWWMIPRVGKSGSEIPIETQMLLLEVKEESAVYDVDSARQSLDNTFYILLLPLLEGQFRASLLGTPANELELCVESGDAYVQTTRVSEAVLINSGEDPFELIKNSFKILEKHMGTFTHIEHKKKPVHLDWFGWCTWDAFYKDVNPRGIKEGLERFIEGGCPPKFLIIDDGWQDTFNEFQKEGEPFIRGTEFASRLMDIKENSKFLGLGADLCTDLHEFVEFIKEKYGLKFVYVWHALVGYWGGLSPSSEKMKKYNPKISYPVQSPGNVGNLRDIAMESLEKYGIGLVDPQKIYDFYIDLHSYLSHCGIDGVKVDVQNVIEALGTGYGGRVVLTRKYQEALEDSVARNFKENNVICCMCHNSDSIYSSKRCATARASEDFMPWEPMYQTLHIASVAYNSLLLGEITVPDWDMFQSHHNTAEFHGAARAVGGCAVYASDKATEHDFKLLKKLVLPDGSILRAKYAGRPTQDCLFVDPVMDGKSLLKIWNLNKLSGVIGVFNCQGAGKWPLKEGSKNVFKSLVLSGHVSPLDVHFLGEVAGENWSGDCAVYAFHSGSLSKTPKEGRLEVSLLTLECEIFTISPIRILNENIHLAPLGLIDMYNSGGATENLSCPDSSGCKVRVDVRGCGRFGAYSSRKPSYCTVDGKKEEFTYDVDNGLLIVKLGSECNVKVIYVWY
ncbi:probable galactinol--sucrose galactosyltransferase 2 isoform X2 [Olea europaea var. sylvestris]|uniref:probable galactinol--sucrose galactosyltransferase 2 isoform X2 n=1 Tax=Olea europaea var. sylvestris TaxID=158386 RepID=UPI000C1D5522|nr:probable galactinol--sucrose galactosyltransferase 2 isoform X2 [Olea europaea var. sylvestris]